MHGRPSPMVLPAAPETKATAERARLLIEQAEAAMGELLEDPLLLFSVLYGFSVASYVEFNGDAVNELAAQFLALAQKQATTSPLIIAHRMMGISLLCTGHVAECRPHYDQAIALYHPEHRPLAARISVDARVSLLTHRSWALWLLGYPEAALADIDYALTCARDRPSCHPNVRAGPFNPFLLRKYAASMTQSDELLALADQKGASLLSWKARGMMNCGCGRDGVFNVDRPRRSRI